MGAIKAVGDQKSSPYKVYSGVLTGLYEGRFVPGQRLVELDLSRIYQVSRNSVREALSRLEAERVILLTPHRGAQIRLLTRVEARGILEMLELLIGLAARLAAKHIHEAKAAEQFEFDTESTAFIRKAARFAAISPSQKRLLSQTCRDWRERRVDAGDAQHACSSLASSVPPVLSSSRN